MPEPRPIEIPFPSGGLQRRLGYQLQPGIGSPDCLNVRPRDPTTGRLRGGSRPMLDKAFLTQIGGGAAVRGLGSVQKSTSTTTLTEPFSGSSLSGAWRRSQGGASDYSISAGYIINQTTTLTQFERLPADYDPAFAMALEMDVTSDFPTTDPLFYQLCCLMNGTQSGATKGVVVSIVFAANYFVNKNFTIVLAQDNVGLFNSGSLTDSDSSPGTLRIELNSTGNNVVIKWKGVTINGGGTAVTAPAAGENHVGFGLFSGLAGVPAYSSEWRFYYTATTAQRGALLLAVSNSKWNYQNATGGLTEVTVHNGGGSQSLSTTRPVMMAEHLGRAYAPNYGTNRYFDAATLSSNVWTASVGTVPTNCSIVCMWRGRIVLAGDSDPGEEQVWYMSRQGDPFDWDYGAIDTDPGRAIAGTSTNADKLGAPITALIPWSNDYLIMGCSDSLFMFAGDPAAGGSLVNLSQTVGIIGPQAWCITPDGTVIFLSRYGLYMVVPGGRPIPISHDLLPRELQNVAVATTQCQMAFDTYDNGAYLFLTPSVGTTTHWFIDWESKTYWPSSYQTTHQPYSLFAYDSHSSDGSKVMIGGSDGYIRRHSNTVGTDDGSTVSSYVFLGPWQIGNSTEYGLFKELEGVFSENSGTVAWEVRSGLTHFECLAATARSSGSFSLGRTFTRPVNLRGPSVCLKLSATVQWSVEQLVGTVSPVGRIRRFA